jgi:3-oxoacyl-[acyl-carrier-protein] synthase-3
VVTTETTSELATEAARRALENSNTAPEEIDMVLCASVSSEYVNPPLACLVQRNLGIPSTAQCLDLSAGCTAWLYLMDTANAFFSRGGIRKMLIIGAESMSRILNWHDRSTCVLFGDGAGAVVLAPGDNIRGTRLHSQPASDKIWQLRTLVPTPYITKEEADVPLQMKGRDVFKFAVTACTRDVEELLQDLGIAKDDVSWYMVHQANRRIIDAIIQYMEQPQEKFPVNITDHGNSSSASCPILLDECNRKGLFKSGDLMVLSAFGAGLLSGVAVLEW